MNFTKYFFIPPFILFLYTCASYGMDETLSLRKIQPELIFDLFNVEKGLKDNGTFVEKLLNSNIAISPDGTQLFIGTKGTVYSLDFPTSVYTPPQKKLKYLIQHPNVTCPPILTLAQKTKDKSIILGSAGNFLKSKQWLSHLIVYNNDTGKHIHVKLFDYPVQALEFDQSANILAIGTTQFIEIYNIKKNYSRQITFRPTISNKFLVDMAISKDGQHLIATAESDLLELFKIHEHTTPGQLNTVASLLEIESIQFPHRKVILAVTKQGLTFMISPYDMLKTNNIYDTTRASQAVKSYPGAIEAECDKVTLNSGLVIASAHWTDNQQVSDPKRHTIKVSVAQNQTPDEKTPLNLLGETEFILKAPAYKDTYVKMSKGRLTTHNECFLDVSFCYPYLVALNSCGKIFLWKLPIGDSQVKNESEEDSQDSSSSASSGDSFQQIHRQKRDRSKSVDHTSSSVKKRNSLSSENIESFASGNTTPPITSTGYAPQKIKQEKPLTRKSNESKKPSPRNNILFSFSADSGKSSPTLTPQNSPTRGTASSSQSSRSQSRSPLSDKGKEKEKGKEKDKKK